MTGDVLASALTCGLKGWRGFPVRCVQPNGECSCETNCGRPGRHPQIKNWPKRATTSPAQLQRWWTRWPDANLGIATGVESNLLVLDVDGDQGEATLAALEDKLGPLPETLEVVTPSGGRHLYFTHPGGRVKTGAGQESGLGPGLDVRGDGGMVLAPPSYRPGGIYEWVDGPEDPAELPEAWAALLRADQAPEGVEPSDGAGQAPTMPYGQTALDLEALEVAEALEGNRNDRLNLAAFRLGQLAAEDKLNLNDAGNRLLEAAVYSGLPAHEAEQTIRSGLAAGMHHPRNPLSRSEKSDMDEKSPLTSGDAPEESTREVEESPPEDADSPLEDGGPTLSSHPSLATSVRVSGDISSDSLFSQGETTADEEDKGLEPAALYGLAGDVVRALEPYTEADPAALLGTLLASVGNAVGSAPHAVAGARAHPAQLYVVLVGETSRARKGTAQATVDQVMAQASPEWFEDHRAGGLASGEGIIAAIHRLDDSGAEVDPETSAIKRVTFQGDLRLQVVEPEFARVLRAASREGSTLSAVLRQAWDGDALAVLTRKDPLRSPPAHVSIAAHVTVEELRATLNDVEAANGFANRFLFVLVRRSKLLPHGGNPPDDLVLELGNRVGAAIDRARKTVGAMTRTLEADALWERAYRGWAENAPPGLVGALTARPEAQTLRLKCCLRPARWQQRYRRAPPRGGAWVLALLRAEHRNHLRLSDRRPIGGQAARVPAPRRGCWSHPRPAARSLRPAHHGQATAARAQPARAARPGHQHPGGDGWPSSDRDPSDQAAEVGARKARMMRKDPLERTP